MGLFSKKISEEEKLYQEENRKLLEAFTPTKALGVKKVQVATQFIYDEDRKQFVVVEGPEDTFKEKNPYVISYDQVKSVSLEIEETWSEDKNEYAPADGRRLLQNQYKEVYWRYDFFLIIETTHPYAKTIRYKMNWHKTVTKVPSKQIMFFRRGFELGGTYTAAELPALIERMEQLLVDEAKTIHGEKVFDTITHQRPDTILGKLIEDGKDDIYLKKIDNMTKHIKRANRIAKILNS
ncbi:MAG: hypothetical protein KBS68_07655 [Clostridiales bacterium]|nr:hypothetical protein [Candidatus Crickella merdequi]